MRFLARSLRFSTDVNGALILLFAALVALALANSPFSHLYQSLSNSTQLPILFWVNDGLMTLFFLVVGLEIRREIIDGELNSFAKSALPAIAALGGMLIPALIYVYVARSDYAAVRGFGIPVATDIAFAVSVLSVFGKRVPLSLKAFLIALAIFDDIGAIILIAVFYSHDMSLTWLSLAIVSALTMGILRFRKTSSLFVYLAIAVFLWVFTLWSGVHPTIAGVVAAFLLPAQGIQNEKIRDAFWLKHRLQPWITFFVLPLFAFLNAGVSFADAGWNDLVMPVSLGISIGLVIGKPIGVFSFTWLCVRLGFAPKPNGATWPQLFGVSIVCGIGFTMSLFVGMLAFEESPAVYQAWVRSGVLLGSMFSAILGSIVLHFALRKT